MGTFIGDNQDWTTWKDNLLSWVQTMTGVQDVVWEHESRPFFSGTHIMLRILGMRNSGQDGIYFTDVPSGVLNAVVSGPRDFTLRVTCRSFDQRPGFEARAIIEGFRSSCKSLSSQTLLVGFETAILQTEPAVEVDFEYNNRTISQVEMSILMAVRFSWQQEDITSIARVTGDGTYTLDSGAEKVVPHDYDAS